MGKVEVSNTELRTVRDAMRELNRLVDRLAAGEAEKFVLMKQGQMRAVVVSLDYFSILHEQAHGTSASIANGKPETTGMTTNV
jgi:hypothetical protein